MSKTPEDIIKQLCRNERNLRHMTGNCKNCKRLIVDNTQRKYKYGCTEFCPEAIKVLVGCGFIDYDGCEDYVRDWEPKERESE